MRTHVKLSRIYGPTLAQLAEDSRKEARHCADRARYSVDIGDIAAHIYWREEAIEFDAIAHAADETLRKRKTK